MLKSIRRLFFRKALHHYLEGHKQQRRPQNLSSAQSIGVLFDATVEERRKQVQDIAQNLEKQGKQVHLLGFFDLRGPATTTAFQGFTRKDLGWNGVPKSPVCQEFASKPFDLLICLEANMQEPLIWMAATSAAGMKVGFPAPGFEILDLALEIPQGKDLHYFMEQLKRYLVNIQLPAHASARTS